MSDQTKGCDFQDASSESESLLEFYSDSDSTIEMLTSTDEKDSDEPSTLVCLDSTDVIEDETSDETVTYCDGDDPRLELPSLAEKKIDVVDENMRERQALGDIVMSSCCSDECILQLTGHAILTTRRKYNNLSVNERRQWLIDKIFDFSSVVNGKVDTRFNVSGTNVCRRAFSLIYNVPPRSIARAIKSVGEGNLIVEHGNKGKKKASVKCEGAKAWMEQYFSLIGDKMPNSKQIHLPSWDTQKAIYGRYKQDMAEQMIHENEITSLSMFYKLWIQDFSHVVIPEVCLF